MTEREREISQLFVGFEIIEVRTLAHLLNRVLVEVRPRNIGADDLQRWIDAGLHVMDVRLANVLSFDFDSKRPPPRDPVRYTQQQIARAEEATRAAAAAAEGAHAILTELRHGKE